MKKHKLLIVEIAFFVIVLLGMIVASTAPNVGCSLGGSCNNCECTSCEVTELNKISIVYKPSGDEVVCNVESAVHLQKGEDVIYSDFGGEAGEPIYQSHTSNSEGNYVRTIDNLSTPVSQDVAKELLTESNFMVTVCKQSRSCPSNPNTGLYVLSSKSIGRLADDLTLNKGNGSKVIIDANGNLTINLDKDDLIFVACSDCCNGK